MHRSSILFFFFFNDTATTEIYTLSLHDALPISCLDSAVSIVDVDVGIAESRSGARQLARSVSKFHLNDFGLCIVQALGDRKSTRLNSSHLVISYAVFCLKKKKRKYSRLFYRVTV